MVLLNPEELKQAQESVGWFCSDNDFYGYFKGLNAIAKAQLKKVVEWGQELCKDHNRTQREEQGWFVKRHDCPQCWQDLKKEASLDS